MPGGSSLDDVMGSFESCGSIMAEHLLEKILPGKLKALYAQSCLLNQVFVKDPAGKMTVEALLNQAGKELGDDISVASFVRYQLGA